MGRLPAVVIIARHGARLDAADEQWHLTSPTPYDTPMTYGGWLQSRALGARITSLLDAWDLSSQHEASLPDHADHGSNSSDHDTAGNVAEDQKESGHGRHSHTRRRKRRIIIHTSPYLRCVQTSIAISAGMAQYHGAVQMNSSPSLAPRTSHLHSGSPMLKASGSVNEAPLSSIPEPLSEMKSETKTETKSKHRRSRSFRKPLLRVDAFLGEWLNPDYFDMITPPPSSVMMVAGAKADLLRTGDYSITVAEPITKVGAAFPGGWGSAVADGDGPLSNMSGLGQALPRRTYSQSNAGSYGNRAGSLAARPSTEAPATHTGYMPLTPSYAISASDPIPAGYVAHARDACIEVDYQWDSMREPQDWGTGGEYGEEWGAMHKRYRKATQAMLSWYKNHGSQGTGGKSEAHENGHDEAEPEIVLIMVSHGAGCNAIIGGLTDRTVLLDVGMASLTMAVRKESLPDSPASTPGEAGRPSFPTRKSAVSIPVSEDYDVKLMASTEHLRAGSNPFSIPPFASSSPSLTSHRHRAGHSNQLVDENFTLGEPSSRSSTSSAIGSVRRVSRSTSPMVARAYTTSPVSNSLNGLWNRSTPSEEADDEPGPGDDMVLNFGDTDRAQVKQAADASSATQAEPSQPRGSSERSPARAPSSVQRTNSQRGLWGSSAVIEDRKERDTTPKRRWTVNERTA